MIDKAICDDRCDGYDPDPNSPECCPMMSYNGQYRNSKTETTETPPEWCPYKLEQLLSCQDKEKRL